MDIISRIINYARFEGFDNNLRRPVELPKGVIRCSSGKYPYQYIWTKADGTRCRRNASSFEEACAGCMMGPPTEEASTEEAEDPDDNYSDDMPRALEDHYDDVSYDGVFFERFE